MSFRIGITIGDVVERDGDLLGDGVNIAARLEGLAQPGGICVSRTVYEQVANKLSVEFADIGEQQVKNIPSPIHAYVVAIGAENARVQPVASQKKQGRPWLWPASIALASLAVLATAASFYFTRSGDGGPRAVAASPPAPAHAQQRVPPQPVQRQLEALVPEAVPFIADRDRSTIRDAYSPAQNHKALAISSLRLGIMTGQKDDEGAKLGAIEACQRGFEALGPARRCEIYAVGNTVVYGRGQPPMPPQPWLTRDPSIERPFAASDIPLLNENARPNIEKTYPAAHKSKAFALSARGMFGLYVGQSGPDEAMRRSLEWCGSNSGIPCMIVALDDAIVVPIPTTMKVVGFFRTGSNAVAPELRDELVQRLGSVQGGWSGVAVGASGRPGIALKAATEQDAVDRALADCAKQDRSCRVIAIGPFSVEPK
jgi:adenylate cyclase